MTLTSAEKERDEGMSRSTAHADRTHPGWRDAAYDFLFEFAENTQEPFISEDVSDASKESGFPQPPTDRAWGSIYTKAAKNKVIERVGIGRSRRRHASICPLWKSLVFK